MKMNKIDLHESGRPFTQEEFIERIKTDKDFAEKWGDLGPVYGRQWRNFSDVDQIKNLINTLLTNPNDRRMIVTAWNPAEIESAVLPPCHYGFQVYTRELTIDERANLSGIQMMVDYSNNPSEVIHAKYDKQNVPKRAISLSWNQRSVDTLLGLPYNIASYGLLLCILGKIVNMVPEELIGNLGDTHIYSNQIDKIKEQFPIIEEDFREKLIAKFPGKVEDFTFRKESLVRSQRYELAAQVRQDEKAFYHKELREPFELPTLQHQKTEAFYSALAKDFSNITHLDPKDFLIQNYQSHPKVDYPLSN